MSKSTPLKEGTVILAEEQYAGRGQASNGWFSQSGKNLTFSLLLYPHFINLEKQFLLTQTISLAIIDALRKYIDIGIKIKWPNDLFYGRKKLGGMLIENNVRGSLIKHTVVGIGINVNQISFPSTVQNAVSLRQILQRDTDLSVLLSLVLDSIAIRYLQLKEGQMEEIRHLYFKNLFGINDLNWFQSNDLVFQGKIVGVDESGRLNVIEGGVTKIYNFKEIQLITDN